MSARRSTARPRACSGLMYAAVPRMTPAAVARAVSVGECVTCGELPEAGSASQRLRQPEVEELDPAVGCDHDVGGLQIPVDDPSLVRGLERLGDLPRNRQRLIERNRSPRDPRVQALALHELHDEDVPSVHGLEGVDRRDAGVIQSRERFRLALEARDAVAVLEEFLRQDFQRDVAIELRVARRDRPLPSRPLRSTRGPGRARADCPPRGSKGFSQDRGPVRGICSSGNVMREGEDSMSAGGWQPVRQAAVERPISRSRIQRKHIEEKPLTD